MINQVRAKVGASMFEASETTPGGAATKFFASQRIALVAGRQIKGLIKNGKFIEHKDGEKIGRNITIQIAKNKLAPPKNSVRTQVYFVDTASGYTGFSKYLYLPEILVIEGIVKRRKGGWYSFGEKNICQGDDNFINILNDTTRIKRRKFLLNKLQVNTISVTREKIKEMGKNLFPVKLKNEEEG